MREVEAGDAERVAALLGELGYPSTPERVRERLATWLGDRHSRVLVATTANQQVVGCLSVHAVPYLERDGRWARIESLVVTESARGTGVGSALLKAAETAAREWKCDGMEVTSHRSREQAHTVYRHVGYEDVCDRGARFWKPLHQSA
ncbi:GNAT family N-acetyltransferase [Blastococcus sp. TF02-09]|nr:GNAT family N-acetyltransferase [Blastococcus sp. TF02-9]